MKIDNKYRVGSPVIAKGKVTVIKELPRCENDPFGYKVADSADGVQEIDIEPIEITKEVLLYFGFQFQCGSWAFKANKHEVIIGEDRNCLIDKKDAGYVNSLHLLKNLLFDNCDEFVLKLYHKKEEPAKDSGSISGE